MTFCSQCGKWAGAHAILPGAATVGLCFCPPIVPTPKREWVGLTDEEITEAFNKAMLKRTKDASNAETNRLFVHCIETKLKEKNT